MPDVEFIAETESALRQYYLNNDLAPIEGIYKSYQSDQLGYYRFAIKQFGKKFKAIILESDQIYWEQGEVKAYFEQSSMNNFFSVKWHMSDKSPYETFGVLENEAILTIEFKNPANEEKSQSKFIKMFPILENSSGSDKSNISVSGSGFFISKDGHVVTNAQVISKANPVWNFHQPWKLRVLNF